MTKAYKIENFDSISRERDRFMLAAQDLMNNDVCWSSWVKDPYSDGKYRVGASRLEAADGGLILICFRHPRQKDYLTVFQADGFGQDDLNPALRAGYCEARTNYRTDGLAA